MATQKTQSQAFVGKGKIYFTPVVNGVEQQEYWVGVADKQEFKTNVSGQKELYEAHTGNDNLWDKTKGQTKTTVEINLKERRKDALAAALRATISEKVAGTVTAETVQNAVTGQTYRLQNLNATNIVITDSLNQPAVLGTNYVIDDAKFGRLTFKDLQGLTLPLKIAYSYGGSTKFSPMTTNVDYYIVRTEGLNTVGGKEEFIVTAHQVLFDPADAFDLINNDFADLKLKGDCLSSEEHPSPYEYEIIN